MNEFLNQENAAVAVLRYADDPSDVEALIRDTQATFERTRGRRLTRIEAACALARIGVEVPHELTASPVDL